MLVIGIAGGSGSGKTTVVKALCRELGERVTVISQDSYYNDMSHCTEEERRVYNFDHPDSIDWDLLCSNLKSLKEGRAADQPVYSFITCARSATETVRLEPADVIIIEGILIFTCEKLRDQMDIKVFVDADADVRILRRIRRDVKKRGRSIDSVMEQYLSTVKPMHEQFVEPSKKRADIIVQFGGKNAVALDLLMCKIKDHLGLEGR